MFIFGKFHLNLLKVFTVSFTRFNDFLRYNHRTVWVGGIIIKVILMFWLGFVEFFKLGEFSNDWVVPMFLGALDCSFKYSFLLIVFIKHSAAVLRAYIITL